MKALVVINKYVNAKRGNKTFTLQVVSTTDYVDYKSYFAALIEEQKKWRKMGFTPYISQKASKNKITSKNHFNIFLTFL